MTPTTTIDWGLVNQALATHRREQDQADRLTCCACGCDLGNADDPYRDPDCACCARASAYGEWLAEEGVEEVDTAPLVALECPTLRRLSAGARWPLCCPFCGTPVDQDCPHRVTAERLAQWQREDRS